MEHKDEALIDAAEVRHLYGEISDMTLGRWLKDEDLNFPRPIMIRRIRYWRRSQLLAWRAAQAEG